LRDWAASALANAIPIGNGYLDSPAGSPTPSGTSKLMPWAPHSLFVELYLNGVYEGDYQLIEKVNVDGNRINIDELAETDTTDDISGGYLLEIDQHKDEDYVFITPQQVPIGLQDPDYTPEVPEQTDYITNYVDFAENALFSWNLTDPVLGWRAYFDEASLVNFYIVNDLMGNVDGGEFYSSDYLYKAKDNPLLYMGPVWDFDISSGNVNYAAIVNPTVSWMQKYAPWYTQVFKDPGFKADVVTQWNELKKNGIFSTWLKSIQGEAQHLEQSQVNNFGRWPMQGVEVWPNPQAAGSYDGEVTYLVNWLSLRMEYMDSLFNNKTPTATALIAPAGALRQGAAVTLGAAVTGGSAPSGSMTFLANGLVLGTAALDGSGHASLTTSLSAGNDSLTAVYSGDDTNALSSSNAASVTVSAPFIGTTINLSSTGVNANSASVNNFAVYVVGLSGSSAPTGTVTFMVDGQSQTNANLVNGTSELSASQLSSGTHSVQAVYGGDNTYQGSSSNTMTLVVPAGDFMLGTAETSLTVSAGQSASTVVSLTPENGFNSAVTFACSELVAGMTCIFSPATVTPAGGVAQSTLTISQTSTTAAVHGGAYPLFSSTALALGLCGLFCRKRRRLQMFLLTIAGVSAMGLLNGCGESPKSGETSAVMVTATSGTLQHATRLLVVAQ